MLFKKFVYVFCIFMASFPGIAFCADLDEMQKELEELNLQLEFAKVKIKSSEAKYAVYNKQIKDVKAQIEEVQKEIEQYSANVEQANAAINATEKSIAESKRRVIALMSKYKARLVQLHKIRQNTLYSSVFAAKDIDSFMNRYEMVKYLLANDKEALERLKNEELQQAALKNTLDKQFNKGESLKFELAEKEKKLSGKKKRLEGLISSVLLEKKVYVKKQKDYEKERKSLEKSLKELNSEVEKTIKETPSLINEKDVLPSAATSEIVSKKTVEPATNAASAKKSEITLNAAKAMQFVWPVSKDLRKEVVEINEENSASILIKLVADAEITAAADGVVLYKGKISGLGDVVMIGHEKGFSTVYAKLDNIWVGINEKLKKGDVIGKIAGGSLSAALHFEIRFGSKKQKPLDYLPE